MSDSIQSKGRPVVAFLSVVCLILSFLVISMEVRYQDNSQKIAELQKKNERLERSNQAISSKLKETQDSLKYATSQDVLWLSRVLYSETDKPVEMYYIAHIVKNRVETCYAGKCSYKEVVLDPYEFSAFNKYNSGREMLMRNNRHSTKDPARWAAAKQIALDVYMDNHFDATHFFAQVSMPYGKFPHWAKYGERVPLASNIQDKRLRAYRNIR